MNVVLRLMFQSEFMINKVPIRKELIKRTKVVVTFLKQAVLLNHCKRQTTKTFRRGGISKLVTLKLVHDQYESFKALLDKQGSPLMEEISKIDMKLLIDFLQPLGCHRCDGKGGQFNTAFVCVALVQAEEALNASSHDCELSWIKKHAAGYLKAKFRAHDIHMISMFL